MVLIIGFTHQPIFISSLLLYQYYCCKLPPVWYWLGITRGGGCICPKTINYNGRIHYYMGTFTGSLEANLNPVNLVTSIHLGSITDEVSWSTKNQTNF